MHLVDTRIERWNDVSDKTALQTVGLPCTQQYASTLVLEAALIIIGGIINRELPSIVEDKMK